MTKDDILDAIYDEDEYIVDSTYIIDFKNDIKHRLKSESKEIHDQCQWLVAKGQDAMERFYQL